MQEHERTAVIDNLNASRDRILHLVDGLTPAQWAWHPAEGRWSIAECLEHIIRVENRIYGLIDGAIANDPPQPDKQLSPAELRSKDASVSKGLLDRSKPREAPEPVRPSGQDQPVSMIADFRQVRDRSHQFASTTQSDLRTRFRPHGAFGEIDCYQWLIVLSLHGARHAEQMEEIKAAPGFPAVE